MVFFCCGQSSVNVVVKWVCLSAVAICYMICVFDTRHVNRMCLVVSFFYARQIGGMVFCFGFGYVYFRHDVDDSAAPVDVRFSEGYFNYLNFFVRRRVIATAPATFRGIG